MNLFTKLVVILGAVLMLTSCATIGRNFSSDYSWIKEGKTKRHELEKVLGEPDSKGYSSGRRTWTYGYYKYRMFGRNFTQKELKIYWDGDTVQSFSFNSSFPEDVKTAPMKAAR